jgi:hypothetical protein
MTDKDFVELWRRVGPKLDRIRQEELRNFELQKQRPLIDALLEIGVSFAQPRITSGLVELERLLAKTKR